MKLKQTIYQAKTKQIKKLVQLKNKTKNPLMQISSIFPFTLFPNSILVDHKKVDIIHRDFFATKRTFTIFINDIRTVKVSHGLFFACIKFEVKGFEQNPSPVCFLPKRKAQKIRSLIIGLCASKTENIKTSQIPDKEAKKRLKKIGQIQTT